MANGIAVTDDTNLFTANIGEVQALGSFIPVPTGPVRARITGLVINDHKSEPGAKVAEFSTVIVEPSAYAGAERRINARVPDATDKGQKSLRGWRTAMESVGYTAAQLDSQGVMNVRGKNFLNKIGHFYLTAGSGVQGSPDQYDNMEFITPGTYEARARAQAAQPGSAGGGAGPVSGPGARQQTAPTQQAPISPQALAASLLD